jgi:hypothetical protein
MRMFKTYLGNFCNKVTNMYISGTPQEKLIYFSGGTWFMRKLFAIMRAIFDGQASIDYVEKTRVLKSPGDVTDLTHN